MTLPFIYPQLSYPQLINNYHLSESFNSMPQGLLSLYFACQQLYPEQSNPLQITSMRKYWLGGNDPLDYISVYNNPGDPKKNISPHWHYISFGLSDLYGDNRVHLRTLNQELSGFGFELTFRLKKVSNDIKPPIWPAQILQSLAKYVFHTRNIICSGDHVSENKPFDHDNINSKIQHMLMTDDPQLSTVPTSLGKVTFIQIVGVTNDELKAAQQWNVNGIIDLMKQIPEAGGDLLVTDMQRQLSIFELKSEIKQAVEQGITNEGSNLSGVSAKCSFKTRISCEDLSPSDEENTSSIENSDDNEEDDEEEFYDEESISNESENGRSESNDDEENGEIENEENVKLIDEKNMNKDDEMNQINKLNDELSKITIAKDDEIQKDQTNKKQQIKSDQLINQNQNKDENKASNQSINCEQQQIVSPMSVTHENPNNCSSSMSYNSETGVNEPTNNFEIKYFKEIHIFLNLEAGMLLPLVLRGRLKHNHHFTYKSTKLAITFLTPSVSGAYVSIEKPFGFYGSWLQILLESDLVEKMIADLENPDHRLNPNRLPKTFCWDNLAITIEQEE